MLLAHILVPQTHFTPTPGVLQDVGAAQHPSPQQGQPPRLGIHPLLSSAGGRGLSAQQQSGSGQWRALLDTHTNTHTHFIKNKIIKKIKSNQKKQKKKKESKTTTAESASFPAAGHRISPNTDLPNLKSLLPCPWARLCFRPGFTSLCFSSS